MSDVNVPIDIIPVDYFDIDPYSVSKQEAGNRYATASRNYARAKSSYDAIVARMAEIEAGGWWYGPNSEANKKEYWEVLVPLKNMTLAKLNQASANMNKFKDAAYGKLDVDTPEASQKDAAESARTGLLSQRNKALAGDMSGQRSKAPAPVTKPITTTPVFSSGQSAGTNTNPSTQPTGTQPSIAPSVTDISGTGTTSYNTRRSKLTKTLVR